MKEVNDTFSMSINGTTMYVQIVNDRAILADGSIGEQCESCGVDILQNQDSIMDGMLDCKCGARYFLKMA